MSRGATKDAQARIEDLTGALQAIGRVVADVSVTPKRRLEQIVGVLKLYECWQAPAEKVQS